MMRFWLRRNLRAAFWVVVVGLVLGIITGLASYLYLLQRPLHRTIAQGYGQLPLTPRPLLASLPMISGPWEYIVYFTTLLVIATAGLFIVLLARTRTVGNDISHGLAVGLVGAYVSSLFGGAWAITAPNLRTTLRQAEYQLIFQENSLDRQTKPVRFHIFDPITRTRRQDVYEPNWQEHRYPDLQGLPKNQQRRHPLSENGL